MKPPSADPMAAPEPAELKVLRQAFRIAYGVGILLCVLWPLALELLLGRIIEPGTQPFEGVLWEIGCTFTLLSMAIALFAQRRFRRLRAGLADLPAGRRPFAVGREILLHSALLELTALFGVVLYQACGAHAVRYARVFILLSPLLFFLLVPRLPAWEAALRGPERS